MDVLTMRLQAVAMLILCAGIAVAVVCCGLSLVGVTLETITVAMKEVGLE
jgi:ABC-type transport system involved in cytochrome bd biosynthesis fused ATPase/permease subunit